MSELKVFSNGTETHVAASVEDALAVFRELIGDDYVADGYGDASDWYECDSDDTHSIHFEDERIAVPEEGFEILEKRQGYLRLKAKNRDWAAWNGRGYLRSTEF